MVALVLQTQTPFAIILNKGSFEFIRQPITMGLNNQHARHLAAKNWINAKTIAERLNNTHADSRLKLCKNFKVI